MKKYLLIMTVFSLFVNLNKGFCINEQEAEQQYSRAIIRALLDNQNDNYFIAVFDKGAIQLSALRSLMQEPSPENHVMLIDFFNRLNSIPARMRGMRINPFVNISDALALELTKAMHSTENNAHDRIKHLAYFDLTLANFMTGSLSRQTFYSVKV